MKSSTIILFSLVCGSILGGSPDLAMAQYDPPSPPYQQSYEQPYQQQPYQQPYKGMHTLKVKPPVTAPKEEAILPTENKEAEAKDSNPSLPEYKTLSPKDALVKPDDLEKWNHIDEAALATTDADIKELIHLIESDRGAVPPQGLFLAAKALADKGQMDQAATYFLAGQLRLEFDKARWPSTPNKDDVAEKQKDSKKSPDQAAPNSNKAIRMDNPHNGITYLGSQIGTPIIAWVVKNPQRMNKAIKAAQAWDNSSPYAYLPDYALTEPVPFEKWEKLLVKTREAYFSKMMNWSKLMERSKR